MTRLKCLLFGHQWTRTGEATVIGTVTYARWACRRHCGKAPKWKAFELGRLQV